MGEMQEIAKPSARSRPLLVWLISGLSLLGLIGFVRTLVVTNTSERAASGGSTPVQLIAAVVTFSVAAAAVWALFTLRPVAVQLYGARILTAAFPFVSHGMTRRAQIAWRTNHAIGTFVALAIAWALVEFLIVLHLRRTGVLTGRTTSDDSAPT